MYYIVDWTKTEDGWQPSLPSETGFLLLAEPSFDETNMKFGLFKCRFPDDEPELQGAERVSPELQELLESAEQYPPAMALSREALSEVRVESKGRFCELFAETLEKYLHEQPSSQFILAEACLEEIGYKTPGGYYWIVKLVGEKVGWVSRDYFIYTDHISDFKLSSEDLAVRFGCKATQPK